MIILGSAQIPGNSLIVAFLVVIVMLLLITELSRRISSRVKNIEHRQEDVATAAHVAAEASSMVAQKQTEVNEVRLDHIEKVVNGHHHWLKERVVQLEAQIIRLGYTPDPPPTPEP